MLVFNHYTLLPPICFAEKKSEVQGSQVSCTRSHRTGSRRASFLSFPTLQWDHHLTLSRAFASYSFPSYNFPFILPILLFHFIPPHSALFMSFGGSVFIPPSVTVFSSLHTCDCVSADVPGSLACARGQSTCIQILTHFYSPQQTY